MRVDVNRCARCGRDHDDLELERLARPHLDATHWGLCPETTQPIFLSVAVNQERNHDIKPAVQSIQLMTAAAFLVCGCLILGLAPIGAGFAFHNSGQPQPHYRYQKTYSRTTAISIDQPRQSQQIDD